MRWKEYRQMTNDWRRQSGRRRHAASCACAVTSGGRRCAVTCLRVGGGVDPLPEVAQSGAVLLLGGSVLVLFLVLPVVDRAPPLLPLPLLLLLLCLQRRPVV